MTKGDRLGGLQMGEARHYRFGMGFGLVEKGMQKLTQQCVGLLRRLLYPKPEVDRDLVIAGAGGVQPTSSGSDQFRQSCFDIHVNVFESGGKCEGSRLYF